MHAAISIIYMYMYLSFGFINASLERNRTSYKIMKSIINIFSAKNFNNIRQSE